MLASFTFNHTFSAIRVQKYYLVPTEITLSINCEPRSINGADLEGSSHRASASFHVMRTWIKTMLDNVIIVEPTSEMGDILRHTADNKVLYCPRNTDDFMLCRLLHSKCSAITQNNLMIHDITISSADEEDCDRHWAGSRYGLPGADYLGAPIVHDKPWWERASIDINDRTVSEVPDTEENNKVLDLSNSLTELEGEILRAIQEECGSDDNQQAEIIQDIWNPNNET